MQTGTKIAIALGVAIMGMLFLFSVKENERQIRVSYELAAPSVQSSTIPTQISVSSPANAPVTTGTYQFSVIPGGAKTRDEFCRFVAVSQDFPGLNCAVVQEIRLQSDSFLYMTFRKGEQVKWIRKPVLVHAGEKIYTDMAGHSYLARCGNQIMMNPQEPSMEIDTSTLERPTPAVVVAEIPVLAPSAPPVSVPSTSTYTDSSSKRGWAGIAAAVVPVFIHHDSPSAPPNNSKCDAIETSCP